MEKILYQASLPRVCGVKAGPVKSLVGFLVSGWGIVSRAGLLSPFRGQEAISRLKKPLLVFANSLIIFSLAGLFLTFYPLLRTEVGYRVGKMSSSNPTVSRGYFGELLDDKIDFSLIAPDSNFSLVIPKIGASAKIIANVNPGKEKEYDKALMQGVAHAAGTGFPGQGELIWLFAHSTDAPWNVARYNAVFYLLRELEAGDKVVVFFSGKRFNYQVFDKKIVEGNDLAAFKDQTGEVLILQTCTPPGTTLKRLLVFAKLANLTN